MKAKIYTAYYFVLTAFAGDLTTISQFIATLVTI